MTQQPGIFALGSRSHQHLYFTVTDEGGIRDALTSMFGSVTSVRGVNVVVGLRPDLARRLDPEIVSSGLGDFEAMNANGVSLPAEQYDLWVWMHGSSIDGLFDASRALVSELAPHASLASEQPAFTYLDSRDMSGFEDGTENPPIHEAIDLFSSDDSMLAPVVLVQRWVHDLSTLEHLSSHELEAVIGRTLVESEELEPPQLVDRSHISRVVIEDDDGEELEMFRRSTPFGNLEEHGLMFVGFAPDHDRTLQMLENMIGLEDGVTDHVTDFSTCTGSGWYVVPAVETLLA